MRGAGITRGQLQNAPVNAVFVWCSSDTMYARCLASNIGRSDLKIVPPSWLIDGWRGYAFTGIVVDHAAELSFDEMCGLEGAMGQVRG